MMFRRTFRTLTVLLCLASLAFAAKVPRKLADVTMNRPGQKPIRLAEYKGKIMLLALLSTDCQHCIDTVPILNRLQKDYQAKGVQVVAATVNPGSVTLVNDFVSRYRPAFPIASMSEEETMKVADFAKDDLPYVPIFIAVDAGGTVVNQLFGDSPFFQATEKNTRLLLDNLISKRDGK